LNLGYEFNKKVSQVAENGQREISSQQLNSQRTTTYDDLIIGVGFVVEVAEYDIFDEFGQYYGSILRSQPVSPPTPMSSTGREILSMSSITRGTL